MEYLNAFLCGGVLCAVGQVLIDRTRLTPARILTGYVVAGVLLQAVGVYQPLVNWGGAGATVPLTGFGYCLAKGVRKGRGGAGAAGGPYRRPDGRCRGHCRRRGVRRSGSAAVPPRGQAVKPADMDRKKQERRSAPAFYVPIR